MTANAPYFRGHFTSANAAFAPDGADEYNAIVSTATEDAVMYTDRLLSAIPIGTLEEKHSFGELLEAATTAARHATRAMDTSKGKRKRARSSSDSEENAAPSPKRARTHVKDSQFPVTRSRPDSAHTSVLDDEESGREGSLDRQALSAVRAVGLCSAAALFRQPSGKAVRKSTRPPMSKLFVSLQLAPEEFLNFQAQAKAYMLDPAYPERQNCVGNRGKSDTDMVKLRLFNCVRDFLDGGAGERFFGEGAVDRNSGGEADALEVAQALGEKQAPTGNKPVWPRDGNKLISLVTPLLRRMVTNERQRMYAIETRKGGARRKEASVEAVDQGSPASRQRESVEATVLSPAQSLHPTSLPASPTAQLSHHRSNAGPPQLPTDSGSDMADTGQSWNLVESTVGLPPGDKLGLPDAPDPEAHIKEINMFLKKDKHIIGSIRLHNTKEAPLLHLPWSELCNRTNMLVEGASLKYTQLKEQRDNIAQSHPQKHLSGTGLEKLRGLAAAATNIQDNNLPEQSADTASTVAGQPPRTIAEEPTTRNPPSKNTHVCGNSPSSRGVSSDSTERDAPKTGTRSSQIINEGVVLPYRIEAMRSKGRMVIEEGHEWEALKLDIASADWADHTLNLVVILC